MRWHRTGFRLYRQLISRVRNSGRRRPVTEEICELTFQMMAENPKWRPPRVHGDLVMIGFEVSERSVSRRMRHAPRTPDSAQRWIAFLRTHHEAIAAMNFFPVPTIAFGALYSFFIIGRERRRILYFNVMRLALGSCNSCAGVGHGSLVDHR
jgi:putative transposase